MNRFLSVLRKTLRWLPLALIVFLISNTLLHTRVGFCIVHLEHFDPLTAVPVVHGLPDHALLERAHRHRVVLGGCVVGPIAAVCPHCHWPIRLRD